MTVTQAAVMLGNMPAPFLFIRILYFNLPKVKFCVLKLRWLQFPALLGPLLILPYGFHCCDGSDSVLLLSAVDESADGCQLFKQLLITYKQQLVPPSQVLADKLLSAERTYHEPRALVTF